MESTITMVLTGVVIFLLAAILMVLSDIRNSFTGLGGRSRGCSTGLGVHTLQSAKLRDANLRDANLQFADLPPNEKNPKNFKKSQKNLKIIA